MTSPLRRPVIFGIVAVVVVAASVAILVAVLSGGGLAERCAQLGPGEYSFDDGSSLSCG